MAVLTLALGIGLNVTFFNAFDGVALKLLPVRDPQKLFRVEQWLASGTTGTPQFFFSWPEYLYYRDHNQGLSDLIAVSRLIPVSAVLPGENVASEQPYQGQVVSPNFFSSLADHAAAGRFFLPRKMSLHRSQSLC